MYIDPELPETPDSPAPEDFPVTVSFFEPLEVYAPIEMLREITTNNLESLQYFLSMDLDTEQRAQLERYVHQRQEFLAWLGKRPDAHAYIALYPTQEHLLQEQ